MPLRVAVWEKDIPEDNLGESGEGFQQQRAIGEYGFASGCCGARPDDALESSVVFVVKHLLEHESFHIELINLDATEGHFAWRQGAAIAATALSQERGQVECQLQTPKRFSEGVRTPLVPSQRCRNLPGVAPTTRQSRNRLGRVLAGI